MNRTVTLVEMLHGEISTRHITVYCGLTLSSCSNNARPALKDPLKRPKGSVNLKSSSQAFGTAVLQTSNTHDVQYEHNERQLADDEEDPVARPSTDKT